MRLPTSGPAPSGARAPVVASNDGGAVDPSLLFRRDPAQEMAGSEYSRMLHGIRSRADGYHALYEAIVRGAGDQVIVKAAARRAALAAKKTPAAC